MKQTLLFFAAAAASLTVSCNKESGLQKAVPAEECNRICFTASGIGLEISTKVDAVTALESFNVIATTGSLNAETTSWSTVATRSGNMYVTDKYWPSTNPSYHFYASNTAISIYNGAPLVTCDGSADVVCASMVSPSYNIIDNNFAFKHIMARIGTVTAASTQGYAVSGVSITMQNMKTGGTYNVRAEMWSSETLQAAYAVPVGENDLYVVPGSYSTSVTFTLTKGDYTGTFTRQGGVTLTRGKVNNIAISLTGDPAVPVDFTVSLDDWESLPVSLSLS